MEMEMEMRDDGWVLRVDRRGVSKREKEKESMDVIWHF